MKKKLFLGFMCMVAFLTVCTVASADIRVLADQEQECITGGLCVSFQCCDEFCDGPLSQESPYPSYQCLFGTACSLLNNGGCCRQWGWYNLACPNGTPEFLGWTAYGYRDCIDLE